MEEGHNRARVRRPRRRRRKGGDVLVRRRRRAAEGRGLPAADAGAGEGVLVQLRDHAADEQPDAAVRVLIPGGPPARPTRNNVLERYSAYRLAGVH